MSTALKLEGAFTALVTPFRDGEVDLSALDMLIDAQIAGGIVGVVPCGSTGESATLSASEQLAVITRTVQRVRGRALVIAGTGTNSTRETIERTRAATGVGADAAMLVMPYYNKPTQRGYVEHVRAVHNATTLPLVLYNVPGRTAGDLLAESVAEIATHCPRVVGIKEATGNVLRTQQILSLVGDRLTVLSGDDALTLGIMACGGRGVISVASNVAPAQVQAMTRAVLDGKITDARKLHFKLLPLYEALFIESNPGPVKAALSLSGTIAPELRLPLVWPSATTIVSVQAAMKASGIV